MSNLLVAILAIAFASAIASILILNMLPELVPYSWWGTFVLSAIFGYVAAKIISV